MKINLYFGKKWLEAAAMLLIQLARPQMPALITLNPTLKLAFTKHHKSHPVDLNSCLKMTSCLKPIAAPYSEIRHFGRRNVDCSFQSSRCGFVWCSFSYLQKCCITEHSWFSLSSIVLLLFIYGPVTISVFTTLLGRRDALKYECWEVDRKSGTITVRKEQ